MSMESDRRSTVRAEALSVVQCAQACGLLLRCGVDVALDLVCSFDRNNFAISDDLLVPLAMAVYPTAALLNHSCAPNCVLSYGPVKGETSLNAFSRKGNVLQTIRTTRDVLEGEELCHAYCETAMCTDARRLHLKDVYELQCECELCTGLVEHDSMFLAGSSSLSKSAIIVPQLQVDKSHILFDKHKEVFSVSVFPQRCYELLSASNAVSCIVSLLAFSSKASSSLTPYTTSSQAVQNGIEYSQALRWLGQALGVDDTMAQQLATCLCESWNRLQPSGCWGWNYVCEDKSVQLEIGVLEIALVLAKQFYNPFHSDVQTIVASLLTIYLVSQDFLSAVASCNYLVDWYAEAYIRHPVNPIIALQMYTLADLLDQLSQSLTSTDVGEAKSSNTKLSAREKWLQTTYLLPCKSSFGLRILSSLQSSEKLNGLAIEVMNLVVSHLTVSFGATHSFYRGAISRLKVLQQQQQQQQHF